MSDAIPEDTKYTAGDQIEFYDVGRFETSKGEVIGAKWLKAPCIVTQRDSEGKMLSGKLQKDELGYVLLNLKTGLPSGTFHKSCIVRKLGNRRRSE